MSRKGGEEWVARGGGGMNGRKDKWMKKEEGLING